MDRLVVGVISKAQGVKGEVKIAPLTDDVSRFKKLSQVYIDGVCRKVSGREDFRPERDFYVY